MGVVNLEERLKKLTDWSVMEINQRCRRADEQQKTLEQLQKRAGDQEKITEALFKRIFEQEQKSPEQDEIECKEAIQRLVQSCLLYTSPSPRDRTRSRMPSSA